MEGRWSGSSNPGKKDGFRGVRSEVPRRERLEVCRRTSRLGRGCGVVPWMRLWLWCQGCRESGWRWALRSGAGQGRPRERVSPSPTIHSPHLPLLPMETDPGQGLGWEDGKVLSGADGGSGLLWPQVTICDSAGRSPWTTRSPWTPRCTGIPGKVFPISGKGGDIVSPGKEEPGFLAAQLLRKEPAPLAGPQLGPGGPQGKAGVRPWFC